MSCAGCAARLEKVVAQAPGVSEAHVNFATGTLVVRRVTSGRATDVTDVTALARRLGYEATSATEPADGRSRDLVDLQVRLAIAVFFGMTAMMPSLAVYWGAVDPLDARAHHGLAVASGVLTIPVVFIAGWPFIVGAWRSILHAAPGMDLLVASGALATFAYSTVVVAQGSSSVYFETSAGIVTLLLVGRLLEQLARRRSLSAIRLLHALSPSAAHVLGADDVERDVATETVARGARVLVRPGERVPLDGRIVSGQSHVDRSLLTGESMPVAVRTLDLVEAGTLNQRGALVIEVTEPVGGRALDRIARTVDRLLERRAPMQTLADRIAGRLAIVVLGIATVVACALLVWTGSLSTALMRAVAVLVIACPCALGLATPMAILVSAGAAARRGILFRDAAMLERAADVTCVLLDKTGTLTEGRPEVVDVLAAPGRTREEVLGYAALAEQGSEHPIARAILAATRSVRRSGAAIASSRGGVVWSADDGCVICVGTLSLLESEGVIGVAETNLCGTVAHVAVDGAWVGAVLVADRLRAGAAVAIAGIERLGMRVALVTGDSEHAATDVAAALGIAEVHAGCSPDDKASLVLDATRDGSVVAFVGDGLNDGPALAAASVGFAVENATDVAEAAAGVTLRAGGIERLVEALELARATRRVMRQNIVGAIGYNAIAIPIAIAGYVTPSFAAAAMAMSSLTVIANSLRLERRRASS